MGVDGDELNEIREALRLLGYTTLKSISRINDIQRVEIQLEFEKKKKEFEFENNYPHLRTFDFGSGANGVLQDGGELKIEASFFEVFDDRMIDLLSDYLQFENENGNYLNILNTKRVSIQSKSEFVSIINETEQRRSVQSQSHGIFQFYLTCNFPMKNISTNGTLLFVDLAACDNIINASEENVGNESDLNISLNEIKVGITALKKTHSMIIFHKSILTRLMQPALSGNFQCLMMINITPFKDNFDSSKFAFDFGLFENDDH